MYDEFVYQEFFMDTWGQDNIDLLNNIILFLEKQSNKSIIKSITRDYFNYPECYLEEDFIDMFKLTNNRDKIIRKTFFRIAYQIHDDPDKIFCNIFSEYYRKYFETLLVGDTFHNINVNMISSFITTEIGCDYDIVFNFIPLIKSFALANFNINITDKFPELSADIYSIDVKNINDDFKSLIFQYFGSRKYIYLRLLFFLAIYIYNNRITAENINSYINNIADIHCHKEFDRLKTNSFIQFTLLINSNNKLWLL